MQMPLKNTPYLVSWNITKQCHLKCPHCYIDATARIAPDEISTNTAFGFIDQIARINPKAMLILTGGEPLLRPDFYDIASYAASKGLFVTLGTSGYSIDSSVARKLKEAGVRGAGVSLDSATSDYHDRFRGISGAWGSARHAMDELTQAGIETQLHFTITKENAAELPAVAKLALEKNLKALNVFFVVCTGRADSQPNETPAEHAETLRETIALEKEYRGRLMIRARCAPILMRIATETDPDSPLLSGATAGCIAGRGYMRIAPDGAVTPCPYIPAVRDTPNLKDTPLKKILSDKGLFGALADSKYNGRCADCSFSRTCGGCRARAYSAEKNIMAEDPLCDYSSPKETSASDQHEKGATQVWNEEAALRLEKVPSFLRQMVRSGVEQYAKAKGIAVITPELMAELKKKAGV